MSSKMNTFFQPITRISHKIDWYQNTTKRMVKTCVVAINLMSLVACGGEKSKSNAVMIGVAIPNFDDTFLVNMKDSMTAYAEKQDNIELIFAMQKKILLSSSVRCKTSLFNRSTALFWCQ